MSDPRMTDERLKSYLNTRQADRERMCLSVLGIDRRFSEIEPRRPEGGPDGGRDIQCLLDGRKCFGAVGFKNNASDSEKQVREIKNKFQADLTSALEAEPELKRFVFFTNVDLSPGHQEALKNFARSRNVDQIELYWREKLRLILDNVEGFAIRLQYLDIPLSDAEQKVFFNRFGADIQNIISGRLDSIEERMEELHFRNWKRGRCRLIDVNVRLKSKYLVDGSNHEPFRFALRLHRVRMYGEGEIVIGCYSRIHQLDKYADFEKQTFIYSNTGMLPQQRDNFEVFRSNARVVGQPFRSVSFGVGFNSENSSGSEPGLDLSELAQYAIDFFCDLAWAPRVDRIEIWYDDYLVCEFINDANRIQDQELGVIRHWPNEANDLVNRPVQYWRGCWTWSDHLCKRKRIGEYDY